MGDQIEIPENVLTHCPKVGFKLARIRACVSCESFAGLDDRFPGSNKDFAVRYMLKCSHDPVRRELRELAE